MHSLLKTGKPSRLREFVHELDLLFNEQWLLPVLFDSYRAYLLSASYDFTIKKWDVDEKYCVQTLIGHASNVRCLALTIDHFYVLSGDDEGFVLLWEIDSGKNSASFECHADSVNCLAVTPDGKSFITGSQDRTLRLWQLTPSGQSPLTFIGHTKAVRCVSISEDWVYSGGEDNSIRVWNISTASQLSLISTSSTLSSLVLSHPCLLISSSWDGCINFWDTSVPHKPQLLRRAQSRDDATCLAVASGGLLCRYVVAGSSDTTVCVWDPSSGTLMAQFDDFDEVHNL